MFLFSLPVFWLKRSFHVMSSFDIKCFMSLLHPTIPTENGPLRIDEAKTENAGSFHTNCFSISSKQDLARLTSILTKFPTY